MTRRQWLIFGAQMLVLCSTVTVAVLTSRASDWQPVELVFLLLFLTIGSDLVTMDWRGFRISGAFVAFVLAMTLLGPAPAAAIGVAAGLVDMAVSRSRWDKALNNLVVMATYPLVGGLLVNVLEGNPIPGC